MIRIYESSSAWKVSKYGVISGPYFPVFGLKTDLLRKSLYSVWIQEKTDQKQFCICTPFTQCSCNWGCSAQVYGVRKKLTVQQEFSFIEFWTY